MCIVCEDADLDLTAKNIIKGGFSYSGQRCTAVKLVLVLESVADQLVSMVSKEVDKLSVGKPEVRLLPSQVLHIGPQCTLCSSHLVPCCRHSRHAAGKSPGRTHSYV